MEQRMYHGNINPDALADYLVNMFNQGYGDTVAQKVGQGNQALVQLGLLSHSGRRIRHSIGVSIYKTPDGVSVSTGQANWFDDPGLGGSLIGALLLASTLALPSAIPKLLRSFACVNRLPVIMYPGLSNLFIPIEGRQKATPITYTVAGHVADEVVNEIGIWIKQHASLPPTY